jgi:hypothetical protein
MGQQQKRVRYISTSLAGSVVFAGNERHRIQGVCNRFQAVVMLIEGLSGRARVGVCIGEIGTRTTRTMK